MLKTTSAPTAGGTSEATVDVTAKGTDVEIGGNEVGGSLQNFSVWDVCRAPLDIYYEVQSFTNSPNLTSKPSNALYNENLTMDDGDYITIHNRPHSLLPGSYSN